ncbi:hypothetical protein [Streptomyces sp. AK02-01A]|uniref:hypothetical protein n=1 Tax=Streptomyces sp. AK02-01A TaxID=3028648 RepID=UPI0029AA8A77|nr:hypothetical protein [Streptomyces sp. AK02-01A]MDX3849708.1 hypothetical protein [Streptomyces sp. AK02-01A]MDX3849722.1 hypothetical protein [Streptomyces sp. AK02-01A]
MSARSDWLPETDPTPALDPDHGPQITESECRSCGCLIAGLDGRYACGVCGWSNHWSEGHRELPAAEDDPDLRNRLS